MFSKCFLLNIDKIVSRKNNNFRSKKFLQILFREKTVNRRVFWRSNNLSSKNLAFEEHQRFLKKLRIKNFRYSKNNLSNF